MCVCVCVLVGWAGADDAAGGGGGEGLDAHESARQPRCALSPWLRNTLGIH